MAATYDEFPRSIDTSEMEPPLTKGQAEEAIRKHHEALRRDEGARVEAFLARKKQVGGDHYKRHKIQPWDVIDEYGLDFFEGNALKYLLRDKGNRIEDLQKMIHYAEAKIARLQNER